MLEVDNIKRLIRETKATTVVVVPDLMHALPIIGDTKTDTLDMHITMLSDIADCPIWMPSFTFSTADTGHYSILHTTSEIGVLNEHYRKSKSSWRSAQPVYNFVGNGVAPDIRLQDTIHPYGDDSMFRQMDCKGFALLSYGTRYGTQSRYLLNYAEYQANVPYRRKVWFDVDIEHENGEISHHKSYYLEIPRSKELTRCSIYRDDIYKELKRTGIITPACDTIAYIDVIDIKCASEYLKDLLIHNPFHFVKEDLIPTIEKYIET